MNTIKPRKAKPKDVLLKTSKSIPPRTGKLEVHPEAIKGNLSEWDFPQAMREIIDNPIDAQAENIHVKFPSKQGGKGSEVQQGTPIMTLDDGCGMDRNGLYKAVQGVGCAQSEKGVSDAGIFHIGLKGSITSLGEMGIVFSKSVGSDKWNVCKLTVENIDVEEILIDGTYNDLIDLLGSYKVNGNLKLIADWFTKYESGTGVLIFPPKGEESHVTWHTNKNYQDLISSVKRTITQIYSLRLKSDTNLKITVHTNKDTEQVFTHDSNGAQDIFYEGMTDPKGELSGTMMETESIYVKGKGKDGKTGQYPMTVKGYFLPDHEVLKRNSQNLFGKEKLPPVCFDQNSWGGKKNGAWGLYQFTPGKIMINDKPEVGKFFGWQYWYPRVRFQVHVSKEHISLYNNYGNKSESNLSHEKFEEDLEPLYNAVNKIMDKFSLEVEKIGRNKPVVKRINQKVLKSIINRLSDKLHQKGLLNVEYEVTKNEITTGNPNPEGKGRVITSKDGSLLPYGDENPEGNSLVVVRRKKKKKKNDFNIVEEALVDSIPFTWEARKGVVTLVLNTESIWYKSTTGKINRLVGADESLKDGLWEQYIEQLLVTTISAFRHRIYPSDFTTDEHLVLETHIEEMYDMYTMYDK